MRRVILVSIATAVVAGCSGTVELDELSGEGGLPIIGGEAPDAPFYDSTVSIHRRVKQGKNTFVDPNIFCSGVAIAPDLVLTAGHCLAGRTAAGIAVYVGNDPSQDIASHLYSASAIQVHNQYNGNLLVNDIAIIRLSTAIAEPIDPVLGLTSGNALGSGDVGAPIYFAGFGRTETNSIGVKLKVDGVLAGFGCDHPDCGTDNDATQIWYYQDAANNGGSPEGPCSGDSGGPAYILRDGTPYVAGLTSYGDAACVRYGVSTRVDAYEGWIATFASGGGGCTQAPVGASCDVDSDCCSNSCRGKAGSRVCR